MQNGDVESATASPDITLHLTASSAQYWTEWVRGLGALICGRTLFDFTAGWGGRHTMDVPVIVVTHQVPTEWVAAHKGRPYSGELTIDDVRLGDPTVCIQGDRVTHLVFPVAERASRAHR